MRRAFQGRLGLAAAFLLGVVLAVAAAALVRRGDSAPDSGGTVVRAGERVATRVPRVAGNARNSEALLGALPAGASLRGIYGVTGADHSKPISFGLELPVSPAAHFIAAGAIPPTGCTGGTVSKPQADPGHLCVFEAPGASRDAVVLSDYDGQLGSVGRLGFIVVAKKAGPGIATTTGTWAVTAPKAT